MDYKLNVKFPNGAEFNCEGSEAAVRDAFDHFLRALAQASIIEAPSPNERLKEAITSTVETSAINERTVDSGVINRLFATDGVNVSLRALPPGEKRDADALILIVYGFRVLKGEVDVTSGRLAICARQSGIQADRMDRLIAQNSQFVTTAGFKKGRRYGLNNPGLKQAEELLVRILG
jgi:hypothetical protein